MPTDRVLVEIVTAANMAGVEQAQAGLLKLNASTIGLGLALGGLIMIGKSAIQNTEAMNAAHLSLRQAADASKLSFDQLQGSFDTWAEANKQYLPDQYDAEKALASFVRAGNSAKDSLRLLGDALDLATIKTENVSDAEKTLELALSGNAKGLKELGITTAEYSAIMNDKTLTTEQKHAALLTLIETKTKDGRKAQDDLKQSTQSLNKDWQDMSTKIGPPLISLFTTVVGWADDLVKALDSLGHNADWNVAISIGLGKIQNAIVDVVHAFEDIVAAVQWLIDNGGKVANFLTSGSTSNVTQSQSRRAAGGPVSAYGSYLVGERGPETLVMGSQGGTVIPNGTRGTTVHNHFYQPVFLDGPSIDRLTSTILLRARVTPGM